MKGSEAVHVSHLFNGNAGALPDVKITSVEYDSRRVVPGSCFVAVKGASTDGHMFIEQAISRGAAMVVAQHGSAQQPAEGVPVLHVSDTRMELARLADRFYGHPSAALGVIGVTGTNGKTTVTYLLQSLLNSAGYSTSRFGTIDYDFPDASITAGNTTPESVDLQRMFKKATEGTNPRCVMEVSSHGLSMGRLNHTVFKGAIFTNLTRDHLDFHSTMEQYEKAKKKLFIDFQPEYSVINIDDPAGKEWIDGGLGGRLLSYGASERADIRILDYESDFNGSKFRLNTPDGELELETKLTGYHNVQNGVAAVAAGIAEGISPDAIARGIASLENVPGRFEKVDEGQDFAVVVDYAHTDGALENALKTAKSLTAGRLICLFGCGGDRDKSKRSEMGRVATEIADIVFVTSDNPRTEDPKKIIDDILKGIPKHKIGIVTVNPDRKEAIAEAVGIAKGGDTILIAGKGHEDYQIIGTKRLDFDDRKIVAQVLREIR